MNTRASPNFRILGTGHPGGVPLLPGVRNIEAVHPDVSLSLQDVANTGNTIENTGGLRNTGDQDTLGVGNIEDLGNIRETEQPMSVLVLMNSMYSVILQERMKTAAGVLKGILRDIHPGIHPKIPQDIHPGIHLGIHRVRTDVNVPHPGMHFFHKLTARISVPEMADARLLMSVLLGDQAHLKKVQITF